MLQKNEYTADPILDSSKWKEEGIYLNELFRLKDTNKFYIYHKANGIPKIDAIEDNLDSAKFHLYLLVHQFLLGQDCISGLVL